MSKPYFWIIASKRDNDAYRVEVSGFTFSSVFGTKKDAKKILKLIPNSKDYSIEKVQITKLP